MKHDSAFYLELEITTAAALFVRAASIGLGGGTTPHHRQCDLARSALAAARAFVATARLTDQFVPYQPAAQPREFDIAPLTPPALGTAEMDARPGSPKPAPVLG